MTNKDQAVAQIRLLCAEIELEVGCEPHGGCYEYDPAADPQDRCARCEDISGTANRFLDLVSSWD